MIIKIYKREILPLKLKLDDAKREEEEKEHPSTSDRRTLTYCSARPMRVQVYPTDPALRLNLMPLGLPMADWRAEGRAAFSLAEGMVPKRLCVTRVDIDVCEESGYRCVDVCEEGRYGWF